MAPTPLSFWQKLQSLADYNAIKDLPERIGCPDCADGGAEWLELSRSNETKRVTFEPPAGLPQQAALLAELKKLYEELNTLP